MKILVTGSRDWMDEAAIEAGILAEARKVGTVFHLPITVIHGAAPGADVIADRVATRLGFAVRPYPANWKRYRDAAGPIRNLEMLVSEHLRGSMWPIDVCLAFPLPNSKGTYHMMHWAGIAGIRVVDLGRRS